MWANFYPFADLPLLPVAASKQAVQIDALWWFINTVSIIMTLLIFLCIVLFAWKYRRRANTEPTQIEGSTKLELAWSIAPFLVMLIMFAWGAQLYFAAQNPPRDAMEVFVTGKQWMWKVQYPNGGSEINALHVPVNQSVKLTMASEDVIHSFSIPAFRVRHDVVPGHYNSIWFTATKPGHYHLFCTEYCGMEHSGMVGWVDVLNERDYANWLAGGGTGSAGSLVEQGRSIFMQNGCSNCHLQNQQGRCPVLVGLYDKPVQLADGRTVMADDAYLRESILEPNAKIAAGFQPNIMPVYKGQLTEANVIQLIAYIRSLSPPEPASQLGDQQRPIVIAPTDANTGNSGTSR